MEKNQSPTQDIHITVMETLAAGAVFALDVFHQTRLMIGDVFTTLEVMTAAGWVSMEFDTHEKRPRYALTEQGYARLKSLKESKCRPSEGGDDQ